MLNRRDLSFDGGVTHSPSFTKKPVDLSDSGSEISDEGYKTSDNSKLALDMHNNTSSLNKDSIIKNHGSRKNSIVRTRSMSTDEGKNCQFFLKKISQLNSIFST